MKKAALLIVSAVLLAISLPAFCQEFPDVPADHWAYNSVRELAEAGIIQGYPDGTFGGKRAMTRYEFAEALAKAIPVITQRVLSQVPTTPTTTPPTTTPPTTPEVTRAEFDELQKMVNEFRDELAAMGVDIQQLRTDMNALNQRVTDLENEVRRVQFTGEANLIGRGEVENTPPAFDIDSRRLAAGNPGNDDILANSTFFTDFDFGVKARASDNINLKALINAGNYLPFALTTGGGVATGVDDFTLWNLYIDAGTRLGPLGATEVMAGRIPMQLTPLTMKFVDPDRYTYVSKLDNGNYILDGGSAAFKLGSVSVIGFAGKADPISDLISPDLILGGESGVEVSQLAGARAVIGTGFAGNVGLTWYQVGLAPGLGRSDIFGADLDTTFGSFGLQGEWAKTDPNDTLTTAFPGVDDNNTAWYAKLKWQTGRLALAGGYTAVESNYFAPGDWLDMGRAIDMRNVKGPTAYINYAFGSKLSLNAAGEFLEPDDDGVAVTARTSVSQGPIVTVPGATTDRITHWKAGLKYGLTARNSVDLGYETVRWDPTGAGDTTDERYVSLGIGHSFTPDASMKLLYQIVEYDGGALAPYANPILGGVGAGTNYRGGVATAQFQLKY